ncbi:MAG: SMP-30/gluconolactonase/LRE family protein [Longimicrobiales bacterium]|nr:SMP-30/gluconolactonase/LRE family protein [Longimicrobiales bacterium]
MTRPRHPALATALVLALVAGPAFAQQPEELQPYAVGNPLGLPVTPTSDGAFEPISPDVTVYGGIYNAESCAYDEERRVLVVPNRGAPQDVETNDAWVSLINHDGSVHTARWIGVQRPRARPSLTPPLTLNDPLGSDIAGGVLYLADRDGGTSSEDPTVAVIRRFDLRTGEPAGEIPIEGSPWLNDLEVADDGAIYATQTGDLGPDPDPATWRILRIGPDGTPSVLVQGAPLHQPNGIGFDPAGDIVVANYGDSAVLTFSPAGELLRTEHAAQAGGDGLVILPDGTKYVSSVSQGGVSRIRPNEPAELIARNIPSAASMCYDAGANQLVIPMSPNNGLAFVPIP